MGSSEGARYIYCKKEERNHGAVGVIALLLTPHLGVSMGVQIIIHMLMMHRLSGNNLRLTHTILALLQTSKIILRQLIIIRLGRHKNKTEGRSVIIINDYKRIKAHSFSSI